MKNFFFLPIVLSITLLLFFSFSKSKRTIVIDAGHGGADNGATVDGYREKDIVLKIAKIIKKLNTDDNLSIVLVRNNDSAPSLADRVSFINKINPEMAISLHLNYSPNEADKRGTEIYIQSVEKSRVLGERLAKIFDPARIERQDLGLLKDSKSPTLLLELGYLSNEKDRDYLTSERGQNEIARKIFDFVKEKK